MNRLFFRRYAVPKELEDGRLFYLVRYSLKTLGLRGKKLAEAPPGKKELYRKQELERSEFYKELEAMFQKIESNHPRERRLAKATIWTKDYNLAMAIKECAIKHGGDALIWEAKMID